MFDSVIAYTCAPGAHDIIITSLLRQNDVATSFWRNNDVIITSSVRWGARIPLNLNYHTEGLAQDQGRLQCIGNYANPLYGVATICHQIRWLHWRHPSLFHTATSLLIWYKMFCVRDVSYRLIWMEIINMLSVYAQSGTHSRFNWWIIVVLTSNPSVMMCVEITDAPKL